MSPLIIFFTSAISATYDSEFESVASLTFIPVWFATTWLAIPDKNLPALLNVDFASSFNVQTLLSLQESFVYPASL